MSDPKMRFSATIQLRLEVDLAEHFIKLPTTQHAAYWALDIENWGFEEEWERPLAWVTSWLDETSTEGVDYTCPGSIYSDVDTEWDEPRTENYGHFAESDFDQLVGYVPWLRPPLPRDEFTREDLFRIPSDTDVALPGPDGNEWGQYVAGRPGMGLAP